jgi:hypothetical protein
VNFLSSIENRFFIERRASQWWGLAPSDRAPDDDPGTSRSGEGQDTLTEAKDSGCRDAAAQPMIFVKEEFT